MCACPGPWQVSQTAFGVAAAAPGSAPEGVRAHTCPWGLVANTLVWSWQSAQEGVAAASACCGEAIAAAGRARTNSAARTHVAGVLIAVRPSYRACTLAASHSLPAPWHVA